MVILGYLKCWRKDCKEKAKFSAFWHSTNQLPTIKPSWSFRQLGDQPEVFRCLTQLYTMHGCNTYYFHCFNIIEIGM